MASPPYSSSDYPHLTWRQTAPVHRWERATDEAEAFYHSIAAQWAGSGRTFFGITGFASVSAAVSPPGGGGGGDNRTQAAPSDDVVTIGRRLETALRRAWLAIRYDHPTIASWVEYGGGGGGGERQQGLRKVYETLRSEADCEVWLERTFRVVRTRLSGRVWANGNPPAPGLPTVFVIAPVGCQGEQRRGFVTRDIVFRAPHAIIDGIGTLQLLGNLFRHAGVLFDEPAGAYSMPAFGDEYRRLSPPLRVAAAIPPEPSPTARERYAAAIAENERLAASSAGLAKCILPYKSGALVPGVHKRTALTLSRAQTAQLLQACKSRSLTPTHAYHAGIATTLRDMQVPKKSAEPGAPGASAKMVRYITYALINHRKECVPPYNGAAHPASVIHSVSGRSLALDMAMPSPSADEGNARDEFAALASQVRAFYTGLSSTSSPEVSDECRTHLELAPAYWARGIPSLDAAYLLPDALPPPVPSPDPHPSVSVSSMGRTDDIIAHEYGQSLQISTTAAPLSEGGDGEGDNDEGPWVTGEELRTGLGVFLGTWRGSLTLSAAWNDAWHCEDEARAFLRSVNQKVVEGLALK